MGKFVYLGLLCAFFATFTSDVLSASCRSTGYHSQVKVKQVLDADLIELASGQQVRLIGIQAPLRNRATDELALKLSAQSSKLLKDILAEQPSISLVLDKELLDSDDHMLAHVFLADGQNIQQLLLEQGAVQLDIQAPNTMFWGCYFQAQKLAIQQQSGVWAHAEFQAKPAQQARFSSDVKQNWLGKVIRVFEQQQSTWLVLNDWLYIQVPDSVKRRYFTEMTFSELIGKQIIVNSSVSYKNNRWQGQVVNPWELINQF
ncbi:thermonuclease family protein [Catenovulum agarivorans]|uniref:thermonuclease family protein n=1 Tax=Catenovulum agarivorans TaxID=1172192 RepID=UPI00031522AC|nr:thermonuclease family protein [Catenovulum agarivorans]